MEECADHVLNKMILVFLLSQCLRAVLLSQQDHQGHHHHNHRLNHLQMTKHNLVTQGQQLERQGHRQPQFRLLYAGIDKQYNFLSMLGNLGLGICSKCKCGFNQ